MLLTLTTTHRPATDLGFLLHKHPNRAQRFGLPFGAAHVVYPESTEERCTAALVLDVDPVALVRRGRASTAFALAQYVNDRPYVASSLMSVALVTVFKSAMGGQCRSHPALAATAIELEAQLPAVPARGGEELVRRLFEPLGYAVDVQAIGLDEQHPEWGDSRHVGLTLTGTVRLADLLTHLYVLLPVLDDEKHYWVDQTEIDKLLHRGGDWLPAHPERELITRRYLKHEASLFAPALDRLEESSDPPPDDAEAASRSASCSATGAWRRCAPRSRRPGRVACSTSAAARARC